MRIPGLDTLGLLSRTDDDDAGHSIRFQEFAEVLFHNTVATLRRMSQQHAVAILNHDAGVKYIDMRTRRSKKYQIPSSEFADHTPNFGLRYTLELLRFRRQPGNNVQQSPLRNPSRSIERFAHGACSSIIANPTRHVVVAARVVDASILISNLPQFIDEIVGIGSASKRQNSLDVRDAVETLERSNENLGIVRGSNQRIDCVWKSEKLPGKNLNAITGRTFGFGFRE